MNGAMHAWPKNGEPTSCCGRFNTELPLSDGRTTAAKGVTCDGQFTPAVWAHEVYPHPSEYADESPQLLDAVRYHLARTIALYPPERPDFDRAWMDQINLMLAERNTACLVAALHEGLAGQAALDWAHHWSSGHDGELIYALADRYEVALDRIKPYSLIRTDAS